MCAGTNTSLDIPLALVAKDFSLSYKQRCMVGRRRISVQAVIAAIFFITLCILLYANNSWKLNNHDIPHSRHEIRHPKAPAPAVSHAALPQAPDLMMQNDMAELEELPAYDKDSWPASNYDVHVFYYVWYGNPYHDDKKWYHWNHRYLPHWDEQINLRHPKGRHVPPDDIGANFYPQLGAYSSSDPEVIDRHMYEIRKARIGVLAVSWYPRGHADDEGKPPDLLMPAILDAASKYDLKVCFHIEPFEHRTAQSLRDAIKYIIDTYGNHKAFYKKTKRGKQLPLFYMYDSYQVKEKEWRQLFSRLETLTVRDTEYDGIFIGLAVESSHPEQIYNSGFDGMYTYFASDTFVYGSKPSNWLKISSFCKSRELMFIPSVGPGYIDTEVRPWNDVNTKDRKGGVYYRKNFKMALSALPDAVSITSFNEWHEGTQIEAAVPYNRGYDKKVYLDYGGVENAYFYMNLTRKLIESMPSTRRY